MSAQKIRVLLAKTGLDGHDRGVKVLARGLLDEGMEVIYLGSHQPEDRVAQAAADEDVDVVGLSLLAGEHLIRVKKMAAALDAAGLNDVVFLVGGTIPREHIPQLKAMGVDEVFEAASLVPDIAEWIRNEVARRQGSKPSITA
jgi:methylmalonyl-CoA mutase C-terminal domain/subunit